VRNLQLKLHPGRVGPSAGAGLHYNLNRAGERGTKLLVLESRAHADSFRLLCATQERAREEAHLATQVNVLQFMEGQKEHDREQRLFEEGRLQDAHAEVDRLRKEQETPKKLKGKKKKCNPPSRVLQDERRVEQHRAYAEELVARLEAERVERAGEEEDDVEKTDWRGVAQDDLDDSGGEPLFEDPRQPAPIVLCCAGHLGTFSQIQRVELFQTTTSAYI
jgi:hypothetical protein